MLLRYGTNPHQPARCAPTVAGRFPLRVVHGTPSYINILDALNAWQLVGDTRAVFDRPAAAAFKHVSPAGAAIAGPLDGVMARTYRLDPSATGPLTSAYARARDADPRASYGDFVAVSDPVDAELVELLRRLVCDGIIAPGYHPGTVTALSAKKNGQFRILEADPNYQPPADETRDV